MVPVNRLSYIHNCFMEAPQLPNSFGTVPAKAHDDMENDSNVLMLANAAGSGPPRPGFVSTQCSLMAGMPIMYERSPEMKPSTAYRNVRAGKLAKDNGIDEL